MNFVTDDRQDAQGTTSRVKQLALRGSAWTLGSFFTTQVLRLALNILLARLLFPEAFGLMAIVNVVLAGLEMISDVGTGTAIIQHDHGENQEFYNTAWVIQIGRGLLLWLGTCALAGPIALLYREPQLASLLPVAGFGTAILGFVSTKKFTSNRRLAFGRLTAIEIFSHVVGFTTTLVIALAYRTVWSFVFASVLSSAVQVVLTHLILPGPANRFHWDRTAARKLVVFGRWILASSLLSFLSIQLDKLLLGKLVGMEVLGVYSIAFTLACWPRAIFDRLARSVLFPSMAEIQRGPITDRCRIFLRGRDTLLAGSLVFVGAVVLAAPLFFRAVYDSRYHDAGWICQLLCAGIWFSLLHSTSTSLALAIGATRTLAISNAVNLIVTAVAAPIGFHLGGITGFILGWSLGNLCGLLVIDATFQEFRAPLMRQDVLYTAIIGAVSIPGIWLERSQHVWSGLSHSLWQPSVAACGLMLCAVVAAVLARISRQVAR